MTPRPGSENEADPNGHQPSDHNNTAPGSAAVERIIERFGGIRPMAHKLNIPVTTVQGWKKRGAIPLARHADLRTAAAKHRVKLDEADLEAATPSEDRPAADVPAADAPVIDAAASVTPLPSEAAAVSAPEGVDAAKPADTLPGADTVTAEPVIIAKPADSDTVSEPKAVEPATAEPAPAEPANADAKATEPAITEPLRSEPPRTETVEPAAPVYTTPEYPREERRSGAGFATAVSLIALLVGAAALSEPWWGPRVPGWPARTATTTQTAAQPAQPAQADPAVRAQLQQIAERVGRLEQRPAAANGAPASGGVDPQTLENALRQLSGRIDQLDQRVQQAGGATAEADPRVNQLAERLGGIEQRVAAVGSNTQAAEELRKEVDGLKQQLASVNQTVETVNQTVETRRDAAASAQALVLAAGQLRSALATGQPFQQELQAVRALGVSDPQIAQPLDAVAAYAGKGVPTQPQLADRFQALAPEVVRAANRGEGNDWVNQVTGKLATLVTVRRQGGGVVGDSADAVAARAEAAVQEGNLAKAVEELAALKGPAADTAAPWIADAKARLAANQAGQQLTSRAIGLLSQAAGGAASGKGNGQ
ncbi:COG4223 family protein [Azospirillum soli]|uniref:COG4223 family protein n=1 Tax=Azospirillum soli TaxID=1304799 RepID=UPI001AE4859F|nr:mitofilin family membrane protein [Azospirillum soli]MBP2311344.1 hypothetical protein [Azospirillum soli]